MTDWDERRKKIKKDLEDEDSDIPVHEEYVKEKKFRETEEDED